MRLAAHHSRQPIETGEGNGVWQCTVMLATGHRKQAQQTESGGGIPAWRGAVTGESQDTERFEPQRTKTQLTETGVQGFPILAQVARQRHPLCEKMSEKQSVHYLR